MKNGPQEGGAKGTTEESTEVPFNLATAQVRSPGWAFAARFNLYGLSNVTLKDGIRALRDKHVVIVIVVVGGCLSNQICPR